MAGVFVRCSGLTCYARCAAPQLLGRNREAIESTSPGEASQQGNDSEVAEEGGEDEGEDEEEASPQQKRKRKKASRDAEPKRKPKKKAAEVDTGGLMRLPSVVV